MVGGSMSFMKNQLGNFMGKNKNSISKGDEDGASLLGYGQMTEDDEESYYEEVIIDDDDDGDYFEEVLQDDGSPTSKGSRDALQATQEQVDLMDLSSAKKYLLALPNAKAPTSIPTRYADDDYEYEEIEISDEITPIRRSQRFSFFEGPGLEDIVEASEHSERSMASSLMHSPSVSKRKQAVESNLSHIKEGLEHVAEDAKLPTSIKLDPVQEKPQSFKEIKSNDRESVKEDPTPEGTILEGQLNDEAESDVYDRNEKNSKQSNKSLSSSTTDTSMTESNTSLDLKQVFTSTPPTSPDPSKSPSSHSNHDRTPKRDASESRRSKSSLDKHFGSSSGHSSGRRRRSGDDKSVGSTRSSRSHRRSSASSGRRSSTKLTKDDDDRVKSVEAEIQELLSPTENQEKKRGISLDAMLSSPSNSNSNRHRDSDDRSTKSGRSSSGRSRRRSSTTQSERLRGEKERRGSKRPDTPRESRSSVGPDSPRKSGNRSGGPSLKENSKTLDDLLARMSVGPSKKSDARSTVSALVRSSRGRTRDGRDSQSVVGGGSAGRSRARSARRTKNGDAMSVASMSHKGRNQRSRSTSVGRKERLRRTRRKDDVSRANRRHKEDMESGRPPSERSKSDKDSSRHSSSSRDRHSKSPGKHIPQHSSSSRRGDPSGSRGPSSRDRQESEASRSRQNGSSNSLNRSNSGSSRIDKDNEKGSSSQQSLDRNRLSHLRSPIGPAASESSADSIGKPSSQILKRIDATLEDMDGNASFDRTMILAKSLHVDNVSREDDQPPVSPRRTISRKSLDNSGNNGALSLNDLDMPNHSRPKSSRGAPRTPTGERPSIGRSGSSDNSANVNNRSSRLDRSNSSRSRPRTPTGERPTIRRSGSSDRGDRRDISEHRRSGSGNLASPSTPNTRRSRRPPSKSQSGRTPRSSQRDEKRLSSRIATSPSSEKLRTLPPRSQSDSHGERSPLKKSEVQNSKRSSDIQQYNAHAISPPRRLSGAPLPSSLDLDSLCSTPSSVSHRSSRMHGRTFSGDLVSTSTDPPMAPSLESSIRVLTPFERLSELEKIKTFLTNDEYEKKKKEILAAV